MLAKLQLCSSLTKNILHLQLLGEFDGSAACELIKKIEEDGSGASKILINTTGLRCVHPFGRTVFQNRNGPIFRKLCGLTKEAGACGYYKGNQIGQLTSKFLNLVHYNIIHWSLG
jgi:hypothetical protein